MPFLLILRGRTDAAFSLIRLDDITNDMKPGQRYKIGLMALDKQQNVA